MASYRKTIVVLLAGVSSAAAFNPYAHQMELAYAPVVRVLATGLWLYYSHISLAALQPHIAVLEPHIADAVATCFCLLAQLCHQTGLLTKSAAVLLGAASQKHTKHSSLCIGIQEALCNRATGRARECDLEALTNVANADFSVCLGVHCSQIKCTARPQCLRAWME